MSLKNVISLSTAGGGKTTKLIKRVHQILEKNGNNPDKILIISFTNSSCDDIYNRCGIRAETLHSFCYRFLPSKYSIEENTSKFTSIFLNNFFYLSQLGEIAVNRLLNSYFIFKKFPENEVPLSEKDRILNNEFIELEKLITEEKLNHNCLFFSDIIHEFFEQLDNFLFEISSQYDHILVDEAQDLSAIQLQIVAKIIKDVFLERHKTFFIVGDVKQSIYNFQGSSPEIYLQFIDELKIYCESKNIDLVFENNETTYRFGGEILKKINKHFSEHKSGKNEGEYVQILIEEMGQIETIVETIIEKHLSDIVPEDIMILFERNNKIIERLQNKLSYLGLNIKIYTQNDPLIDGLKDIVGFLQTESNYFVAKILQGPFFHLTEPHFYLLNQSLKENLINYDVSFFEQIKYLRFSPHILIEFLLQRTVHISHIEAKLLKKLYQISFSFNSIDSMIINLPETIKLHEKGIQFSTIHSAKGLEADIVITLPQNTKKDNLVINLNPFFFFTDDVNDFTRYIISSNFNKHTENRNNLYYVSLTRAKKFLYEISFANFN